MRMPASYDAWLEAPYQRRASREAMYEEIEERYLIEALSRRECPNCGLKGAADPTPGPIRTVDVGEVEIDVGDGWWEASAEIVCVCGYEDRLDFADSII